MVAKNTNQYISLKIVTTLPNIKALQRTTFTPPGRYRVERQNNDRITVQDLSSAKAPLYSQLTRVLAMQRSRSYEEACRAASEKSVNLCHDRTRRTLRNNAPRLAQQPSRRNESKLQIEAKNKDQILCRQSRPATLLRLSAAPRYPAMHQRREGAIRQTRNEPAQKPFSKKRRDRGAIGSGKCVAITEDRRDARDLEAALTFAPLTCRI